MSGKQGGRFRKPSFSSCGMQYLSLSFSTHIVSSLLRKLFLCLISGIELGGLNRALAEVVGSPSLASK